MNLLKTKTESAASPNGGKPTTMRTILAGTLALLGAFSVLLAVDSWRERSYTEWTQEEVTGLLTDSPWTQEVVVRLSGPAALEGMGRTTGQPTGQAGARTAGGAPPVSTVRYYISFLSAEPIRMALARNALLQGNADDEEAREFVERPMYGGEVAVMIRTEPPGALIALERISAEEVRESCHLELRRSKRRLSPIGYIKPSESEGMGAVILFSRNEIELAGERELRFDLRSTHRLNRTFRVDRMVFQEEPAL
jgi:hypothetical protein